MCVHCCSCARACMLVHARLRACVCKFLHPCVHACMRSRHAYKHAFVRVHSHACIRACREHHRMDVSEVIYFFSLLRRKRYAATRSRGFQGISSSLIFPLSVSHQEPKCQFCNVILFQFILTVSLSLQIECSAFSTGLFPKAHMIVSVMSFSS